MYTPWNKYISHEDNAILVDIAGYCAKYNKPSAGRGVTHDLIHVWRFKIR